MAEFIATQAILYTIAVVSFSSVLEAVSSADAPRRCRWNEYTVQTDTGLICRACPNCPVGHGLSPQCGTYIKPGDNIQCVACEEGLTYSNSTDLMACRPCSICGPHEATLRKCSPTRNAKCGKCLLGYYRAVTDDCHKCSWCCPDSKDSEVQDECISQGLPRKQSCRYDVNTLLCGPKTSSSTHASLSTNKPPRDESSSNEKEKGKATDGYVWLTAAAAVIAVSVTVCIVAVFWVRRQRQSYQRIQYVRNINPDGQGKLKTFTSGNNNNNKCNNKVTTEAKMEEQHIPRSNPEPFVC